MRGGVAEEADVEGLAGEEGEVRVEGDGDLAAPLGVLGVAAAAERELGDLGGDAGDVAGEAVADGAAGGDDRGLADAHGAGLGLGEADDDLVAGAGAVADDGEDGEAGAGDLAGADEHGGDLTVGGGAEDRGVFLGGEELLLAGEHGELGVHGGHGELGGVDREEGAAGFGAGDLADELGDQGVGHLQLFLQAGVGDGEGVELAAVGHALGDEVGEALGLGLEGLELGGADVAFGAGGLEGEVGGGDGLVELAGGLADADGGLGADGAELGLEAGAFGGDDGELGVDGAGVEGGDDLAGGDALAGGDGEGVDAGGDRGGELVFDAEGEADGGLLADVTPQPGGGGHGHAPHAPRQEPRPEPRHCHRLQLHRRLL